MREPLYLVDGYGLIYRSYFAFIRKPLLNPQGRNSSAVFGFFRSLFQLVKANRPSHLAVVLDSRTPTFRHRRLPGYKANREKAPQDLHAQVPVIEEILEALAVPCLRRDGFEADDLMATLALRCRAEGRPCYLLSSDKDILQLVGGEVFVLHPPQAGGPFSILGREEVKEARGVYPERIVDYLSLTGDQSDNVPGVPGVGEKTALKLLAQFPDLEAIYSGLESVQPQGLQKKLREGRESAFLSRELVRLHDDVPLEAGPEALRCEQLRTERAIPLFARQGMRTLVEELGGKMEEELSYEQIQKGRYETVVDKQSLDRWIEEARSRGIFAFDTETTGLDELRSRPIGFSLATAPGRACYIPIRARGAAVLAQPLVRERLRALLEDPRLKLVGQNIKFDYKVARGWGLTMRNIFFDTMVAAWVLDSELSSYGMDSLALRFLRYKTIHYEEVVGKNKDLTLADFDLGTVTDYSAEDADITFRLYEKFAGMLKDQGLERIFYELEMPLVEVLAKLELAGILLAPEPLLTYSRELQGRLQELEKEVFALCGHSFNIRSTRELQEVLFNERKLQPTKRTKTGFSTDTDVLEELAQEDRVPALVLRHRSLSKLQSTYVDALPLLVNPDTGRLHTHYLQTGTATGRLSSKDPNLQNIPIREEEGRRIRSAFIPAPGYVFLSADYAQIELVVLASLSRDPMLIKAFQEGRDIHRQTAAVIFGLPEGEVTPAQRRIGKTVNFGVIYGMSAFRLARDFKLSRREAGAFITRYFERYSRVKSYTEETVRRAEEKGYVETLLGRRRALSQIGSRNRTEKMQAERMAVNSPIQGTAADIVKLAMIAVSREMDTLGLRSRLLLQVHDELIFEVAREELVEVRQLVRPLMESCFQLEVPLQVHLETGASWGEIH